MKLDYVLTPDSFVVITRDGETHNMLRGYKNFQRCFDALASLNMGKREDISDDEFYALKHFEPNSRLRNLSGRLAYDEANGTILFDGDEVNSTLASHIALMCEESNPQLNSFVLFMENLAQNPSERAREELYNWIDTLVSRGEKLTITTNGMLMAYKGVMIDNDGDPASKNAGPGYIDGVYQYGHLKNKVGSVVSVSRSYVDDNELIGCSRGLHAGTWSYASSFASGKLLRVEVHPRDVVSVPKDCAFQKIRCCRYTVIEENDHKEESRVVNGTFEGWTPSDWVTWGKAGYDMDSADVYSSNGYTLEDALYIEEDGGLEGYIDGQSLNDWLDIGTFDLSEILSLLRAKVTLEQASNGDFDASALDESSDLKPYDYNDYDDEDDYNDYDDEDDYDEDEDSDSLWDEESRWASPEVNIIWETEVEVENPTADIVERIMEGEYDSDSNDDSNTETDSEDVDEEARKARKKAKKASGKKKNKKGKKKGKK